MVAWDVEQFILKKLKKNYKVGRITTDFSFLEKLNINEDVLAILKDNAQALDFYTWDGNELRLIEVKSGKSELSYKQRQLFSNLIELNIKCYLIYKMNLESKDIAIFLNDLNLKDSGVLKKIRDRIIDSIGLANWDGYRKRYIYPRNKKDLEDYIKTLSTKINFWIEEREKAKKVLKNISKENYK